MPGQSGGVAGRDLPAVARGLRDTIWAARQETDALRRLPPAVVEALRGAGLNRLAVEAALGGFEADALSILQVYEELGAIEASAAWIVWNNQLGCIAGRHLADEPRRELFGNSRALFANSTRPSAKAYVVEGGIRLVGRWTLVSGCELADWLLLIGQLMDGDEPRYARPSVPASRMGFVPKGSFEIVDTWTTGGLRGTGSHDVVADGIFVPDERTCGFMDPIQADVPILRMPFRATMAANMASISLGVARAAVDAFVELAHEKLPVNAVPRLRDRPEIHIVVAGAAAELDAARLLLHAAVGDLWAACVANEPRPDALHGRAIGGAAHAIQTAKRVVTTMFEVAGTSALYVDNPLERAHRDVFAIGQHSILGPKFQEDAGRIRMGLPSGIPLF
ncbi:MAG: acyl-CoA dehydrogenase family protein [Chloroflexota bacterium]